MSHGNRRRDAIIVGLVIALLGPLIASIGAISVGYIDWSTAKSSVFSQFPWTLYLGYTLILGIVPSISAGVWAAYEVARSGWVSLSKMSIMVLTISAACALVSSILFGTLSNLPESFLIFLLTVGLVAIALRLLIIFSGLMPRPVNHESSQSS